MKTLLASIFCFLVAGMPVAEAQTPPGWLRYPAISPDGKTIVFTYKGDLYRVPASGGTAIPLTAHEAHDFMPVWSHDGRQIAFASDRYGNFDVFVIPAEGGEASRATFHSAQEYPYSFSSDDKFILFGATRMDAASNRGFPTGSQPELYRVPAGGGRVEQVLTTPAEDVKVSRNGQFLIFQDKKGGENAWRKHHTSAIARDIWVYDSKAGTDRKITTFAGEDRNPRVHRQGPGPRQAGRHADARHLHFRRLGDAAGRQHSLGRAPRGRQGRDDRQVPREPPDGARHQGDERVRGGEQGQGPATGSRGRGPVEGDQVAAIAERGPDPLLTPNQG
jgi:hypothetical protein